MVCRSGLRACGAATKGAERRKEGTESTAVTAKRENKKEEKMKRGGNSGEEEAREKLGEGRRRGGGAGRVAREVPQRRRRSGGPRPICPPPSTLSGTLSRAADSEGLALKIDDPRNRSEQGPTPRTARGRLPERAFGENQQRRKDGGGNGKTNGEDSWNDGGYEGGGYGGGGEGMRAVTPGVINAALRAKSAGKNALHELEDMPAEWRIGWRTSRGREGPTAGRGRRASRAGAGDRAIGSLVGMVNNVVDEFT